MDRKKILDIFNSLKPSPFIYKHTMILEKLMYNLAVKYNLESENWINLAIAHGLDLDQIDDLTDAHGHIAADILCEHQAPHYIIFGLLVHSSPVENLRKKKVDKFLYISDMLVYVFLKYAEENNIDIKGELSLNGFIMFLNNSNKTSKKELEIINLIDKVESALSDRLTQQDFIKLMYKSIDEIKNTTLNNVS